MGGLERVYELGKDFRNEGVSFKHNPEFTMLEWYEAYADYGDTMARIEQLVATRRARGARHDGGRRFAATRSTSQPPWARIAVRRGARASTGCGRATTAELRARLTERGRRHRRTTRTGRSSSTTRSRTSWSRALIQPTIVHDYPVELSPFARPTDDDPTLVERFEYFAGGMELGNAFSELNDPRCSRPALRAAVASASRGEPGDPDYVEALAYGMPPTGGLGLGIDRSRCC